MLSQKRNRHNHSEFILFDIKKALRVVANRESLLVNIVFENKTLPIQPNIHFVKRLIHLQLKPIFGIGCKTMLHVIQRFGQQMRIMIVYIPKQKIPITIYMPINLEIRDCMHAFEILVSQPSGEKRINRARIFVCTMIIQQRNARFHRYLVVDSKRQGRCKPESGQCIAECFFSFVLIIDKKAVRTNIKQKLICFRSVSSNLILLSCK